MMAKQGLKHQKVISSGRLTGAAKLPNARKSNTARKLSSTSVDSGYSLYSTDSEDQVTVIHKGLDKCAALLQDILQNESTGAKSVPQKTVREISMKTKPKNAVTKTSSTKRKVSRKNISVSDGQKERGLKVAPSSVVKEKSSPTSREALPVNAVCVPHGHASPMSCYGLSEPVQTQMAFINGQLPVISVDHSKTCCTAPEHGSQPQSTTVFNDRLPTSTPSLSPQHPTNPVSLQMIIPTGLCTQCTTHTGDGVKDVPPSSAPAISVPSSLTGTAIPAVMTFTTATPPSASAELRQAASNQQFREQELLKYIQQHLNQLQQGDAERQKAAFASPRKIKTHKEIVESDGMSSAAHCETTSEEDENATDEVPVRDTSCQTSFESCKLMKLKKTSPEKTAQKVRTIRYLLGELKALATDQDDSEVIRLINELEESVGLLPAVVGSTNVQAEIALALQPLRSENAHLRRRLRILNQQLRERERMEKDSRFSDCNFELLSVQSMNMTLQTQLTESQKNIELLQEKNGELLSLISEQKEENKHLLNLIQEKEQDMLQNKQRWEIDISKVKAELDDSLVKLKGFQLRLEATEKENHILGITLRQRDAEVNRLRELTSTLQSSMAKLLSDLSMDKKTYKSGSSLTRSVLDMHEKSLKKYPELDPVSNSVASYLKNLEIEPGQRTSSSLSIKRNEDVEGDVPFQYLNKSGPPDEIYPASTFVPQKKLSPRTDRVFLARSIDTQSDICNFLREGYQPDETIYIPLIQSNSKKQTGSLERETCTPPRISKASKRLNYSKVADSAQHNCSVDAVQYGEETDSEKVEDDKLFFKPAPAENLSHALLKSFTKNVLPASSVDSLKESTVNAPEKQKELHSLEHLFSSVPHKMEEMQKISCRNPGNACDISVSDCRSAMCDWSMSSLSTFNSHDEQDFKTGLAALDASIARVQQTLRAELMKK
ncbi:coiled-coil domain-containing protein 14 [Protopterus annectens]|uniref:coiled-coil domain-containing protein 14 n=1 Tax=Protopterus annectens TaxID=7888 RepID=UPI001CF980A3|nr:coiled-coil domain-containing protein 14 [Protopterus annectens]